MIIVACTEGSRTRKMRKNRSKIRLKDKKQKKNGKFPSTKSAV